MHQSRVNLCGRSTPGAPTSRSSVHASEPREPLRPHARTLPTGVRSVHASEPREPLRPSCVRWATSSTGVHASEPREPLRRRARGSPRAFFSVHASEPREPLRPRTTQATPSTFLVSMHQSRVNLCGFTVGRLFPEFGGVHASEPREPLRLWKPSKPRARRTSVHASEPREPLRLLRDWLDREHADVSMHQSRVNLCGRRPRNSR